MSIDKLTDSELWEISNGITTVLQSHKPNKADNVYMFWYDLFKSVEREIDKRLLAGY